MWQKPEIPMEKIESNSHKIIFLELLWLEKVHKFKHFQTNIKTLFPSLLKAMIIDLLMCELFIQLKVIWVIANDSLVMEKIYEWMQIILRSFMPVDQLRLLNKFTFCGTLVSLHLIVCIQSVMNYLQQSNLIGWHNNTKTTWNKYIVDFFDIIQQKENYLMSFWQ